MDGDRSFRLDRVTSLRASDETIDEAATEAKELGLRSVGEYFRYLHEQHVSHGNSQIDQDGNAHWHYLADRVDRPKLFRRSKRGRIYHGDSLGLLRKIIEPGSVDLIFTSPPFGLVRKKAYGNVDAEDYVDWFRPFAEGFRRVLKENGSLVIDIGSAWVKGSPTKSLYHFKLLIMLCEEFGFHLCQEHYCWNPSRLPSPTEWVNVERIRVKDAVNCVWWLSPSEFPKANNRNVLAPYSKAMKALLKKGYKPKLRPSGHDISPNFGKDNGGAVPPNLLAIANTESNSEYLRYCKEHDLKVHPARFPAGLPEYFVRFLTDEDDVVLDPFAGSCVTGEVSEELERRWICCEIDEEYLNGARGRFLKSRKKKLRKRSKPYEIHPPCAAAPIKT